MGSVNRLRQGIRIQGGMDLADPGEIDGAASEDFRAAHLEIYQGFGERIAGVDVDGAAIGGGELDDFTEAHEGLSSGLRIVGIEGDGDGFGGVEIGAVFQDSDGDLFFPNYLEGPQGAIRLGFAILG